MPETLPLLLDSGHLFLRTPGGDWLFDTGSPASFGGAVLRLDGVAVSPPARALGLDAAAVAAWVGRDMAGLLGMDAIGRFDWALDPVQGVAKVSAGPLAHAAPAIPLETLLGVPLLEAEVAGLPRRLILDTGAQLSYFAGLPPDGAEPTGTAADFHPALGRFEVETWRVAIVLGGHRFWLRVGAPPPALAATLACAGVEGILGIEALAGRRAMLSARRRLLALGPPDS